MKDMLLIWTENSRQTFPTIGDELKSLISKARANGHADAVISMFIVEYYGFRSEEANDIIKKF